MATPAATATAIAVPSVDATRGSWTLVKILPRFEVWDAVGVAETVLAVGCEVSNGDYECDRAAIRMSDGGEWRRAQLDGETARVQLEAIANGPDGYVAVGRDAASGDGAQLDGAAFVSADGRSWRRSPDQASLDGRALVDVVARRGGGWIAVGAHAGPSHFFGFDTWSSTDGLTWTRTASMPEVGSIQGVTTYNGGLIAWGSDCGATCGPPERAAIWTSDDGVAWSRAPKQPALARGMVNAVVPTASGLVAIGATYDSDGAETASGWASRDGRSWSRTLLRNGAGYRGLRLAFVPGGLLAIGSQYQGNDTTSRTWTMTDGSGWTRLRGADLEAETPGLAGTTTDVIAIGRTSGSQPGDSKVWRLRLD